MLRAKFPGWLTTPMLALSVVSVGVNGVWGSEASTQEAFTGDARLKAAVDYAVILLAVTPLQTTPTGDSR